MNLWTKSLKELLIFEEKIPKIRTQIDPDCALVPPFPQPRKQIHFSL